MLPSPDKVSFILCEQVREEARGKIGILGVYMGGDIVVADPAESQLALTMLWIFEDGDGDFRAEVTVTEPNGNQVLSKEFEKVTKKPESNMAVAITWLHKGFQVGTYNVRVRLDDRVFAREFRIRQGDPFANEPREPARLS